MEDRVELRPAIRRARYQQLTIFEVSDTELAMIERGSPESAFLTFSVFFLSSGLSFTIALLTTNIESIRTFTVFVVLATLGLVVGSILFSVWLWNRRTREAIFQQVRSRLPPDGIPEQIASARNET